MLACRLVRRDPTEVSQDVDFTCMGEEEEEEEQEQEEQEEGGDVEEEVVLYWVDDTACRSIVELAESARSNEQDRQMLEYYRSVGSDPCTSSSSLSLPIP